MTRREWLYEIAEDMNSEQHQYDSKALNGVDNSNPIITCYLNNDFHIFMDNSLKEIQELLLADTFDRIKERYIPGLFKWLEENNAELINELVEIEDVLNEFVLTEDNYNEYKSLLESHKVLYEKAIAAYKAKSKIGGTA